jgi:hypothetical protein
MDETRAVARLPHLDVEIVHRRLADQEAEQLAISLRATPSFDVFQRHLERRRRSGPGSFLVWQRMLQQAWRPWLQTRPTEAKATVTRNG